MSNSEYEIIGVISKSIMPIINSHSVNDQTTVFSISAKLLQCDLKVGAYTKEKNDFNCSADVGWGTAVMYKTK